MHTNTPVNFLQRIPIENTWTSGNTHVKAQKCKFCVGIHVEAEFLQRTRPLYRHVNFYNGCDKAKLQGCNGFGIVRINRTSEKP